MTKKILWKFQTGIPTPSPMKDMIDIVTEATAQRFTRWKPEVIGPKGNYDFRAEKAATLSDITYQASHSYQSGVGNSYTEERKKKKRDFLPF
jgi:hypothetical protein